MTRQVYAAALTVIAVLSVSKGADAALVIDIRPTNTLAAPNSTGNSFDVFVVGTASDAITNFDVTLSLLDPLLAPATDVLFTGGPGGVVALADYVFDGLSGATGPTVSPLVFSSPTISFQGAANVARTIGLGDDFLLGTVLFDVGAVSPTPAAFSIRIDNADFANQLTSTQFSATNEGAIGGTITVSPAAVPEPSSMTLLAVCGLAGGGAAWRRRRASAKAAQAVEAV
jgi:hypothetical protein